MEDVSSTAVIQKAKKRDLEFYERLKFDVANWLRVRGHTPFSSIYARKSYLLAIYLRAEV